MEAWDEESSSVFSDYGELFTPRRPEFSKVILRLIPAEPNEAFLVVDIGCGTGWLLETILRHFPTARAIGLDGSALMRNQARVRLAPFGERVVLRDFKLERVEEWANQLSDVRCFVSTLAIHHLDGNQKQELFKRLRSRLTANGALLITDLILPTSPREWSCLASSWDTVVMSQSLAMRGDLSGFDAFKAEEWNYYAYPDSTVDHPSTLNDQLNWLQNAGYSGVDVFWMLAGHALFGGYNMTG